MRFNLPVMWFSCSRKSQIKGKGCEHHVIIETRGNKTPGMYTKSQKGFAFYAISLKYIQGLHLYTKGLTLLSLGKLANCHNNVGDK